MKKLSGNQIRKMFLDFFVSKGHKIEPSVSLIPVNDPTLLWINAGVAGLKKYFDGREKPVCNRITNAQKCIRTNDIENVGKTARHHTFFEMLGNFSIGDYFKEDALKYAYEFLTSKEWIGFDPDRLYVTVYPDDQRAYDIWTKEIGLNPKHILKSHDNFWQIGEGPSGPDSEIYYDRGPSYDPLNIGEDLFFQEKENERYVEVWNVVFSQYDAKEGVDRKDFKELPQKNIDTGMGLERLTCLVQDGESNFDTDLFLPYIHKTEEFALKSYQEDKMAYRVIADHIRTCVFALADGAIFSNEGRGYVLRRVLRRAMRYGRNIGINKAFLYEIVDTVCDNMKDFYPYLQDKKDFIKQLILKEEEAFLSTLSNGEKLLMSEIKKSQDGTLAGETIFKLYDTYGFPKEMTVEIAEDVGLNCDLDGFEVCMNKQKEMARNAREVEDSMHSQSQDLLDFKDPFSFTGYDLVKDKAKVVALFKNGKRVSEIKDEGDIVFDHSCFYATSGGQCADTGLIYNDEIKLVVTDVKKAPNQQFLHHVQVIKGEVKEGNELILEINAEDRKQIKANHTSLHLLQSALRTVLGNHINQAGSYVCKDYARFDFTHFEKVNDEQLNEIENLINKYIADEYQVNTQILDIEEAKKTGAIALFDEKYSDKVRVVSIGDVSKEFCGGTHVINTCELGVFKINSEESIGSGIRRIEVVTKLKAYDAFKEYEKLLANIKQDLKVKNNDLILNKLADLLNQNNELNIELNHLKNKLIQEEANSLVSKAKDNGKFKYLILDLKDYQGNLKEYANNLKNKLNGGFVFIANTTSDKISIVCACGESANNQNIEADSVIKNICTKFDGKGGGKKDLAQGGIAYVNDLNSLKNELELLLK